MGFLWYNIISYSVSIIASYHKKRQSDITSYAFKQRRFKNETSHIEILVGGSKKPKLTED